MADPIDTQGSEPQPSYPPVDLVGGSHVSPDPSAVQPPDPTPTPDDTPPPAPPQQKTPQQPAVQPQQPAQPQRSSYPPVDLVNGTHVSQAPAADFNFDPVQGDFNQKAAARLRASGQKFFVNVDGAVEPSRDAQGNFIYEPSDKVVYDKTTGKPIEQKVDATGRMVSSDPDATAPIEVAPNDPGVLYKKNNFQPWTPVGNAYDIAQLAKNNPNLVDPAIAAAAFTAAQKGDQQMSAAAKKGIDLLGAQAKLSLSDAQDQEKNLNDRLANLGAQLDQIKAHPAFGQTEGGFLGFGGKPTSTAATLQSQADAIQQQIDQTTQLAQTATETRMKAEADKKQQMHDNAALEEANKLNGYQNVEQRRRDVLAKQGLSEDQIANDPLIATIQQKKDQTGIARSQHEQISAVMQDARDRANATFAKDPATIDDINSLNQINQQHQQDYQQAQDALQAAQARVQNGAFTNPQDRQTAVDALNQAQQRVHMADVHVGASMASLGAAVDSARSNGGMIDPTKGARNFNLSVDPDDLQVHLDANRDPNTPQPSAGAIQPKQQPDQGTQTQTGYVQQAKDWIDHLFSGIAKNPGQSAGAAGAAVAEQGTPMLAGMAAAHATMAVAGPLFGLEGAAAGTAVEPGGGTLIGGGAGLVLASVLSMASFFGANWVVGKVIKWGEKLAGIDKSSAALQQAQPEAAQLGGAIPTVGMLADSIPNLARAGVRRAMQMMLGGAAAGAAFEPVRYGVELGLSKLTGSDSSEVQVPTMESELSGIAQGAMFAGMGQGKAIKQINGWEKALNTHVDNYEKNGGSAGVIAKLGEVLKSIPAMPHPEDALEEDKVAADQKIAMALNAGKQPGEPEITADHVSLARRLINISPRAAELMQIAQERITALDAAVAQAREAYKGINPRADIKKAAGILEAYRQAVNERMKFLSGISDQTTSLVEHSMMAIKAAQELKILGGKDEEIGTGLVRLANNPEALPNDSEKNLLIEPPQVQNGVDAKGKAIMVDQTPFVYQDDTGKFVVTDKGINWLQEHAPISSRLIPLDETGQLEKNKAAADNENAPSPQQQGTPANPAGENQPASGENSPAAGDKAGSSKPTGIGSKVVDVRALTPEEKKSADVRSLLLQKVGVSKENADAFARQHTREGRLAGKVVTDFKVAGGVKEQDRIGKSILTSEGLDGATSTELQQHAEAVYKKSVGRELTPDEQSKISQVIEHLAPAVARWRNAFKGIVHEAKDNDSGGVSVKPSTRKLGFNIHDLIERGNLKALINNPDRPEMALRHEAAHSAIVAAIDDMAKSRGEHPDKIVSDIWTQLPEKLKADVRESYDKFNSAPSDDHALCHEFLRMVLEGKIKAEDISIKTKATLSEESLSPTIFAHIKDAVTRIVSYLKKLSANLKADGVDDKTIGQVEEITDNALKFLADMRKLVDQERSQKYSEANDESSSRRGGDAGGKGEKGSDLGSISSGMESRDEGSSSDGTPSKGGPPEGTPPKGGSPEGGAPEGNAGENKTPDVKDDSKTPDRAGGSGAPSLAGEAGPLGKREDVSPLKLDNEKQESQPGDWTAHTKTDIAIGLRRPGPVELSSIQSSAGTELQPRDRRRQANKDQEARMATNWTPERTKQGNTTSEGPILYGKVDGKNVLLSGHGRQNAQRLVYGENGEKAQQNREWIKQEMARNGYSPEEIAKVDSMKEPIWASEVSDIGEYANNGTGLLGLVRDSNMEGMSKGELAASDANILTRIQNGRLLSDLQMNDDGNFLDVHRNKAALQEIYRSFGSPRELVNKTGEFNDQFKSRVEAALLAYSLGPDNTDLITTMVEGEGGIRNLTKGVMLAAPELARSTANGGVDIGQQILKPAIDTLLAYKKTGDQFDSLAQFLDQGDFLREKNPAADALLFELASRNRSAKKIGEFLTDLARKAANEAEAEKAYGGKSLLLQKTPEEEEKINQGLEEMRQRWKNDGVDSFTFLRANGDIHLGRISMPKEQRGQGIGTAKMNELLDFAQKNGVRVSLTPGTDYGGSSESRLVKFYKSLGFVMNKGRNQDFTVSDKMLWTPKEDRGDLHLQKAADDEHAALEQRFKSGDESAAVEAQKLVDEKEGLKPDEFSDLYMQKAPTEKENARMLELQRKERREGLNPFESQELVSLQKKAGQNFMPFFDADEHQKPFTLEQEVERVLPPRPKNLEEQTTLFMQRAGGSFEKAIKMAEKDQEDRIRIMRKAREASAKGEEVDNYFFSQFLAPLLRKAGLRSSPTPQNILKIVKQEVPDVIKWLKKNPQYQDYYHTDWDLTHDLIFNRFPQMTEDKFWAFRLFTAACSAQTKLPGNMKDSVQLLNLLLNKNSIKDMKWEWNGSNRKTGKGNPFVLEGASGPNKIFSLHVMENLYDKLGSWEAVKKYLHEPIPSLQLHAFNREVGFKSNVGDIGKIRNAVMEATGQNEMCPRMFIFGPKIGAYMLNLTGDDRFTTVDIWEGRYIRSMFPALFKTGTGLFENVTEQGISQRFATAFNEEFNRKAGMNLSPAALQAVRWFYMIDAAKRAGYANAKTDQSISGYTAQAIRNNLGPDSGSGRQGKGAGNAGRPEGEEQPGAGASPRKRVKSQEELHLQKAVDDEYFKAVDSGDEAKQQKLVDKRAKAAGWGGDVLNHGTTHNFTVFSTERSNIENDLGKGFYFTSSPEDAKKNYAGEGPDLTSRIERQSESVFDNLLMGNKTDDQLRQIGKENGVDFDAIQREPYGKFGENDELSVKHSLAKAIARKQLSGGGQRTIRAYVKLNKPAIIGGGKNETRLEMSMPVDEEGEYTDEEPAGSLIDFINGLKEAARGYGSEDDVNKAAGELMEHADYESIKLSDALKFLKKHEGIAYTEDPHSSDLASNELIREALEEAGYDGIIDHTVNEKFGSQKEAGKPMDGMNPDTYHVVAFDPRQIKSADPITRDENGKIIPLSQRFDESHDSYLHMQQSPEEDQPSLDFGENAPKPTEKSLKDQVVSRGRELNELPDEHPDKPAAQQRLTDAYDQLKSFREERLSNSPAKVQADAKKTPAELFTGARDIIDRVAAKFDNIPGYDEGEARQKARLAVLKAAQSYDATRGVPFDALANIAANNALKTLYKQEVVHSTREPAILNEPYGQDSQDNPVTLQDQSPDKATPLASEQAQRNEAVRVLDKAISELPDKLQTIARGLLAGKNDPEIAEEIGMTKQGVGKWKKIILQKLRGKLGEQGISNPDDLMIQAVPDDDEPSIDKVMEGLNAPIHPQQDEINQNLVQAKAEEGGDQPYQKGVPRLAEAANMGPEGRAIDSNFEKNRVEAKASEDNPRTLAGFAEEGRTLVSKGQAEVQRITDKVLSGEVLTPGETMAAKIIARQLQSAAAGGDVDAWNKLSSFWSAYRETGSAASDALNARRDDNGMTVSERHRAMLLDAINEPSRAISRKLANEPDPKKRAAIMSEESTRLLEALNAAGITTEMVLGKKVAVSPVVKNWLSAYRNKMLFMRGAEIIDPANTPEVRRRAFEMILKNKSIDQIAKATGLTPEDVQGVKDRAIADLRNQYMDGIKKGSMKADGRRVVIGEQKALSDAEAK